MERRVTVFLSMVATAACLEMLPFGTEHGDSFNPKQDDGCSSAQQLSQPVAYMGNTYDALFVCNNGAITFGAPASPYITQPFPIAGFPPAILPLWADTDVTDPLADFGDESDYGNRVRDFDADYILEDEIYNVYLTEDARDAIAAFGDQGFECTNGFLVFHSWVCDGREDCSDGADEIDCPDNFYCQDGTQISNRLVCDGSNDCSGTVSGLSEDEQSCSGQNEERLYTDDNLAMTLFNQRETFTHLRVNLANNILKREITDPNTLDYLSSILEEKRDLQGISKNVMFAYLATWYHVGGYRSRLDAFNTFQCVLMTTADGQTFVMFNYQSIQWTTTAGMQGTHAQAGFNYGNSAYYMLPYSRGFQVDRLASLSNVNDPGLWLFRLDPEEGARCNPDQINSISPYSVHAYGGQTFRLSGFCGISDEDILTVQFISSSREKTVNASLADEDQIVGVYPYWGVMDSVEVGLFVNGVLQEPKLDANYYDRTCGDNSHCGDLAVKTGDKIHKSSSGKPLHVVIDGTTDQSTSTSLILSEIPGTEVMLIVMEVHMQNGTGRRLSPELREVWRSTETLSSDGFVHVSRDVLSVVQNTGYFVHFVVSRGCLPDCPNLNHGLFPDSIPSSSVYRRKKRAATAIFPPTNNSTVTTIVSDRNSNWERKCNNWLSKEEQRGKDWHSFISEEMPCPRRGQRPDVYQTDAIAALNWMKTRPITFAEVESCNFCPDVTQIAFCIEYDPIPLTDNTGVQFEATNKCCYDKSQELITNIADGAGRVSRTSVENGDDLAQRQDDVKSFDYCCSEQGDQCDRYLEYRPVIHGPFWTDEPKIERKKECKWYTFWKKCWWKKYIVPAITLGHPHYVTFDGLSYIYNGLGVYTASQSGDFAVQISTRQFGNGTAISGIAVKDGNELVSIYLPPESDLELSINNRNVKLGLIKKFSIGNVSVSWENGDIFLNLPSGLGIKVMPRIGILNYYLNVPPEYESLTEGLLGNFNGNLSDDLQSSSGEFVSTGLLDDAEGLLVVHENFGESWRVPESDWLFLPTVAQRIKNEHQNSKFVPSYQINFKTEELQHQAEQVCSEAHNYRGCLLDVASTDDIRFAELLVSFADDIRVIQMQAEVWRDLHYEELNNTNDSVVTSDNENTLSITEEPGTTAAPSSGDQTAVGTVGEDPLTTGASAGGDTTKVTTDSEVQVTTGASASSDTTGVTTDAEVKVTTGASTADTDAGGETRIPQDDDDSSLVLIIGLVPIGVVLIASVAAILTILFRTITAKEELPV